MSTLTQTVLKIEFDYGQSVEPMVKVGKYDHANRDITARSFPSQGKGTVQREIVLFHPDCYVGSEEVLAEMDKMGLRAGTLAELLALGSQHPDEQRQSPIVALGSVWRGPDGFRYVPYLWGSGSSRGLGLDWFGLRWDDRSRFLAVRRSGQEQAD